MDAVTVTADSRKDLEKLLACEPLRRSFDRLIVVDNMSSDGSAEVAQRAGAEVIQVSPRQGYAQCVNLGVSHTTGPRFVVLNPDIAFCDEQALPTLETHFDEPDVGLVAPALILPDGALQDSARRIPTPLDLVLRRGGVNRRRGEIDSGGDVPWVVGACLVARRAAWDAVGGLDESYALYFEDVDLCWRLRQAGWKTRLDRAVRVEHKHGAASRKSVFGWAARQHVASAARFYGTNPRFIWSPRLPAVGAPASVASPAPPVAALAAAPDLLGSLDYVARDRHLGPVTPATVRPAPVRAAPVAAGVADADGRGASQWLAGRARASHLDFDSAHVRRLAAGQWSPQARSDAGRWLPEQPGRSAVAA